ncbi:hypothetical protein D5018_10255 [Parashewanella curva]|uniref:Uncharacterized protein n=1 Tax=Parashewanella curva TaxID=2338552 RepID=A0A3L8PYT5_9GAMM|nr:hypothetical protein [Parashewanella curva]RLV59743.1 hypothetical protein D5018_10255 [Parashewanella curva]
MLEVTATVDLSQPIVQLSPITKLNSVDSEMYQGIFSIANYQFQVTFDLAGNVEAITSDYSLQNADVGPNELPSCMGVQAKKNRDKYSNFMKGLSFSTYIPKEADSTNIHEAQEFPLHQEQIGKESPHKYLVSYPKPDVPSHSAPKQVSSSTPAKGEDYSLLLLRQNSSQGSELKDVVVVTNFHNIKDPNMKDAKATAFDDHSKKKFELETLAERLHQQKLELESLRKSLQLQHEQQENKEQEIKREYQQLEAEKQKVITEKKKVEGIAKEILRREEESKMNEQQLLTREYIKRIKTSQKEVRKNPSLAKTNERTIV